MKRKEIKISTSALSQQAAKIKISNKVIAAGDESSFKKKMEKGAKTLASCPLPE